MAPSVGGVPYEDVVEWFDRRTFAGGDRDVEALARRKRERGLTVSVVLPARDEADTIEAMVHVCCDLRGHVVDEVVVMDGGSRDGTAQLAAAAGATVHQDSDVLPEAGPALGKGDALWRSLTVTSGDVVIFIDSDIRNPDPRFVLGLLEPLLEVEEVQFVKAFYDRPLQVSDEILQPHGGGRVTELMARPLLNQFWPALSGIVQPLSGEYAGRRDLLESLAFFTGYGVEFGLLVDILDLAGLGSIGQVDLRRRVHRNQSVHALSRMAFAILQVALRRLDGEVVGPQQEAGYVQFTRLNGTVEPSYHPVPIVERPPLRTWRDRARARRSGYNDGNA